MLWFAKNTIIKAFILYIIERGVTMRKKQIEESIQMIIHGFFHILTHMNFHDITMSDIAEASKVSRMTLYRYFKNKDEIVTYYFKSVVETFKSSILKHPTPNILYILKTRNQMIYDDIRLRQAFNHEHIERLFREVIDQSESFMNTYIPLAKHATQYKKRFVEGGISQITRDWVKNGMVETPDQISLECVKLLLLLKE